MTRADEILLFLIRWIVSEYSGEQLSNCNIDWTKIAEIANAQSVSSIVIDGLEKYVSANSIYKPFANEPHEAKRKRMLWIGQMMASERQYVKHETALADLARIYAKAGIRMMVLKGYGLSLDWSVPNHRPVGDLDIYNFGKWHESDEVIEKECGIKIDDTHEHHTVFNFEGTTVENHYDFINTKAHRDAAQIESKLKAIVNKGYKTIDVQGVRIYLPSADFNVIFLMRHLGQHFAGDHLNLRQVLDWGFFVKAHHKEIDWGGAIPFLKEIGIDVFFNQINAVCVDYLGFDSATFPAIERDAALETRIIEDILHPEFSKEKPKSGLVAVLVFKFRRWWHNRWKHSLVYKESLLPMFFVLLWSHLIRYKTIKD